MVSLGIVQFKELEPTVAYLVVTSIIQPTEAVFSFLATYLVCGDACFFGEGAVFLDGEFEEDRIPLVVSAAFGAILLFRPFDTERVLWTTSGSTDVL